MSAMQHEVARLFPGGSGARTMRVGLEHEMIAVDCATRGVVPVERLREAIASSPVRRLVSFEPGGQLELSLPPGDGARAGRQLARAVGRARSDCAAYGVRLLDVPVDTRRDVPLQLCSRRYDAMQRHFDSIGPAGRRMMRRTASTQVCLDWWPGRAGLEQWRVLQLAGPFLAAVFARGTGSGSRLATWLAVDPARTAYDDRLLAGDDPVAAYVEFARSAVDFLRTGEEAHLTTLFPPVRPRTKYLEVRFADVQRPAGVVDLVQVLSRLAYDDVVRRRALRWLAGEAAQLGVWWRAAVDGDDPRDLGEGIIRLTGARRVPELDGVA